MLYRRRKLARAYFTKREHLSKCWEVRPSEKVLKCKSMRAETSLNATPHMHLMSPFLAKSALAPPRIGNSPNEEPCCLNPSTRVFTSSPTFAPSHQWVTWVIHLLNRFQGDGSGLRPLELQLHLVGGGDAPDFGARDVRNKGVGRSDGRRDKNMSTRLGWKLY